MSGTCPSLIETLASVEDPRKARGKREPLSAILARLQDPASGGTTDAHHRRCTFTDAHGRRCPETGALEFDHRDGFARTGVHRADRIRLLCRAHNQHGAEQMYGRAFMERARASSDRLPTPAEIPSG